MSGLYTKLESLPSSEMEHIPKFEQPSPLLINLGDRYLNVHFSYKMKHS
jgi:hypothetical protein